MERTQSRMTTGIERTFRRVKAPMGVGVSTVHKENSSPEQFFREFWLHFIHFTDEATGNKSSKLDKMIPGKLYKIARPGERSSWGEAEFVFPESEDGKPTRLVCLGDK